MSTLFCSDLHFSHESMAIKYRKFISIDDYNSMIISNWNKAVSKRDKVFILGDITMEKRQPYYLLDQLNGFKSVVLGNHDREQDVTELQKHVEHISGMVKYNEFWLTHCPIHPSELRGKVNIHGHLHNNHILDNGFIDRRYFNVSLDVIDFKPITIEEIRYKIKYEI